MQRTMDAKNLTQRRVFEIAIARAPNPRKRDPPPPPPPKKKKKKNLPPVEKLPASTPLCSSIAQYTHGRLFLTFVEKNASCLSISCCCTVDDCILPFEGYKLGRICGGFSKVFSDYLISRWKGKDL